MVLSGSTTHLLLGNSDEDSVSMLYPHYYNDSALLLHFIQCPFPNQIQFGLEKLHPKIAYDFPNQFQFGLEREKLILQDADSKPNSDWFGKF